MILSLLFGIGLSAPAAAQDVQVEAPVLSVGDETDTVDAVGVETSMVIESDALGFLVQVRKVSGQIQYHRYNADMNFYEGATESGIRRRTYEPHIFRYKFPLYVGSKWTGQYTMNLYVNLGGSSEVQETSIASVSCEAMCIERIAVHAGSFEAFKISCLIGGSGDSDLVRKTYWYAPAVGVTVRSETENVISGERTDWYELYAYKRANLVEFSVLPDGVESTCDLAISMTESAVLKPN